MQYPIYADMGHRNKQVLRIELTWDTLGLPDLRVRVGGAGGGHTGIRLRGEPARPNFADWSNFCCEAVWLWPYTFLFWASSLRLKPFQRLAKSAHESSANLDYPLFSARSLVPTLCDSHRFQFSILRMAHLHNKRVQIRHGRLRHISHPMPFWDISLHRDTFARPSHTLHCVIN